jgi:hypothetical protein
VLVSAGDAAASWRPWTAWWDGIRHVMRPLRLLIHCVPDLDGPSRHGPPAKDSHPVPAFSLVASGGILDAARNYPRKQGPTQFVSNTAALPKSRDDGLGAKGAADILTPTSPLAFSRFCIRPVFTVV